MTFLACGALLSPQNRASCSRQRGDTSAHQSVRARYMTVRPRRITLQASLLAPSLGVLAQRAPPPHGQTGCRRPWPQPAMGLQPSALGDTGRSVLRVEDRMTRDMCLSLHAMGYCRPSILGLPHPNLSPSIGQALRNRYAYGQGRQGYGGSGRARNSERGSAAMTKYNTASCTSLVAPDTTYYLSRSLSCSDQ
jgi:hypothetical protein